MFKYFKYLVPLVIFIVLAVVLKMGLSGNPRYVPSQQVGKPAPSFTLPKLLKPEESLSTDELRGKVWVLNLWGSWCPTCRMEHPALLRLAHSRVAPLYGLNWKDPDRNVAVQWLSEYQSPYLAVGYDPDGRVGIDWGAYAAPETFIIDKEGVIRFHYRGEVTNWLVDSEMLPLIKELKAK